MRRIKTNQNGYTLLELMAVIVGVAILVAIIIFIVTG